MAHRLRRSIVALPVLLALASPAAAADPEPETETPSELMSDALAKMVQALELFVKSIPQYEKPEITEDGDIIIRRKRPDAETEERKGPPRLPDPDQPEQPDKGRAI